jgi:predicted transcriptional regulator
MARDYKVNKIKLDIGSYRHYWRGIKKIGKTTLFRDLILEEYGDPNKGLLISMGNETGYQALDGLTYDEAKKWETFEEIVDDLVSNRKDNEFKLIAFDTVDELVAITVDYAMRLHKSRTGKDAKSINEVLGGYGAGREFVKKSINTQISRLENAGYGLIFIGHTKLKDIKETAESEGYQQLTSNLSADYDGLFADKADILATFYNQRIIKDGVLKDKQRYIYFRNDGFIDCGSRFTGMPDKVEMSAKAYLDAFEQGVKASMTNKLSDQEMAALKQKELAEKEAKAKSYTEGSGLEEMEDMEKIPKLREEIIQLYTGFDADKKEEAAKLFKQYDDAGNPNRIKDVSKLEELKAELEVMKEVK